MAGIRGGQTGPGQEPLSFHGCFQTGGRQEAASRKVRSASLDLSLLHMDGVWKTALFSGKISARKPVPLHQSSSELSSEFSSAATFQFFLLLRFSCAPSLPFSEAEAQRFLRFFFGCFSGFSFGLLSSEPLESLSCPEEEVGCLGGFFLAFRWRGRLCFPAPEAPASEESDSWEGSDAALGCSLSFFFRFLCDFFFRFFLCDFLAFFFLCSSREDRFAG